MGVDAEIYFETKDGALPELEVGMEFGRMIPVDSDFMAYDNIGTATHCVAMNCNDRYYGEGYERGYWCALCSVLMLLHASCDVVKVWYGGDTSDTVSECTPEDVIRISAHFMKHGNRPYRSI